MAAFPCTLNRVLRHSCANSILMRTAARFRRAVAFGMGHERRGATLSLQSVAGLLSVQLAAIEYVPVPSGRTIIN